MLPYLSWERTKLELSLYVIRCCSPSLYRTSVCPQHKSFSRLLCRMVLFWILDISCLPVVRNTGNDWKKLKLKGKGDCCWGPNFLLSYHLPCSCRGTQSSTRLEPGWTLSHTSNVVRMLGLQTSFFLSLQIWSCFAKQLANTDIGCTGPSWLAGSKMSLCLFLSFWESQQLVLA